MTTFTVLQNKLLFELVPAYTKNIHNSKDIPDLKAAARVAFNSVIEVLFPGKVLSIRPKMPDPQEVSKEESKDGLDFVVQI